MPLPSLRFFKPFPTKPLRAVPAALPTKSRSAEPLYGLRAIEKAEPTRPRAHVAGTDGVSRTIVSLDAESEPVISSLMSQSERLTTVERTLAALQGRYATKILTDAPIVYTELARLILRPLCKWDGAHTATYPELRRALARAIKDLKSGARSKKGVVEGGEDLFDMSAAEMLRTLQHLKPHLTPKAVQLRHDIAHPVRVPSSLLGHTLDLCAHVSAGERAGALLCYRASIAAAELDGVDVTLHRRQLDTELQKDEKGEE